MTGISQEVLNFFRKRNELVHPRYIKKEETRSDEIPGVFEEVWEKYPVQESDRIANEAIDSLLKEFDLEKLKHITLIKRYSGPPRPDDK